ncbi:MAG: YedE family putative selenium transporter, partial [Oscillospiraceae bacterium]
MAVATREFKAKAGSSPAIRFVLGAFVMVGALAFLGCPLRMIIRLGGGDLNALVGLLGFIIGILIGIFFMKKGFSLRRAYEVGKAEGMVMPTIMAGLLLLFVLAPALFKSSEAGPGSKHAPMLIALVVAIIVGALAQRTRLCMVGGIRDSFMFKDFKLLYGFIAVFAAVLVGNLIMG